MRPARGPWATIGMALSYVLAVVHVLPRLLFYPRLGTWSLQAVQGEPSISWYGYVAWALVGGAVGAAIGARVRAPWRLALAVPLLILLGLFIGQKKWFGL
jgi:hypothetical protein